MHVNITTPGDQLVLNCFGLFEHTSLLLQLKPIFLWFYRYGGANYGPTQGGGDMALPVVYILRA